MNRKTVEEALEVFNRAGGHLCVNAPDGSMMVLKPAEAVEFIHTVKQEEFWAKRYGLSLLDYRDWTTLASGEIDCGAETARGKACRGTAVGCLFRPHPVDFRPGIHLRCAVHPGRLKMGTRLKLVAGGRT